MSLSTMRMRQAHLKAICHQLWPNKCSTCPNMYYYNYVFDVFIILAFCPKNIVLYRCVYAS